MLLSWFLGGRRIQPVVPSHLFRRCPRCQWLYSTTYPDHRRFLRDGVTDPHELGALRAELIPGADQEIIHGPGRALRERPLGRIDTGGAAVHRVGRVSKSEIAVNTALLNRAKRGPNSPEPNSVAGLNGGLNTYTPQRGAG